jgi:hypothetical protein
MVMPMPEKRDAKVERPDPQAKRCSRRKSKRNECECCDGEISADLFHDPASELTEKN